METIKDVLMSRDEMSSSEADELIKEAKKEFMEMVEAGDMEGAEEIFMDYFGLEPDYMMEFIC